MSTSIETPRDWSRGRGGGLEGAGMGRTREVQTIVSGAGQGMETLEERGGTKCCKDWKALLASWV